MLVSRSALAKRSAAAEPSTDANAWRKVKAVAVPELVPEKADAAGGSALRVKEERKDAKDDEVKTKQNDEDTAPRPK